MGSRPLRMKVWWGCPPRVLSPQPHRTQSWRPCLSGQPWASGWRSADCPVPSPRGWTIGFSERGAAHNRALPQCLSSQRCMRSWRSRRWPLSWTEAARRPPPSSLPSTAEWPGGTRAFPRWRERSRCTCAHETPPLGGTVHVPPSKACRLTAALAAKAYSTAGQATSALHAMAILQVHQAKVLKQVHEGSTDPGLMQELRTATDFALRATKVTARSLAKAMSSMVVQERHLWLNLAEMKDIDKARFFDAPISQAGLFGDTVEGFAQQFSAIQQQTEAIQHTCPGVMHHPPLPPGPGLSPPVAVGTLLHPPELLAPGRIDTLAGASSLSQESGAPRVPVRPQVVQEVDEVGCAVGAACTASGGVAHAAQPVSLAHAHNSTRLRDSVRQATSQVQRRSRDAGGSLERPGLAWGDCCPPGKGRNRAGPSSQKEAGVLQPLLHRTQETWWPSTNPGSASYEPGFTQAPSRCGHAGALSNASSPRIGLQRSTWRMLTTCFDPSATQTVPTVCVWRSGIAVQDPPLRAHESRRKAPLPRYGRWASGSSTTSTIGLS